VTDVPKLMESCWSRINDKGSLSKYKRKFRRASKENLQIWYLTFVFLPGEKEGSF